jgi:hypothetical protein
VKVTYIGGKSTKKYIQVIENTKDIIEFVPFAETEILIVGEDHSLYSKELDNFTQILADYTFGDNKVNIMSDDMFADYIIEMYPEYFV